MTVTNEAPRCSWVKVTGTIYSGCVDRVFPWELLPSVQMEPSPMSQQGRAYVSAAAEPINNLGQDHLKLRTNEGDRKRITFQVAPTRKPLVSIARLNDAGNDVNLHADRPHILHNATGERIELRRVGKAYTVDLSVWMCKDEKPEVAPVRGGGRLFSTGGGGR